jgi:hypothetical protein
MEKEKKEKKRNKKMLSELKHKFNIISFLFLICGCGAGLPPFFSPSSFL